MDQVLRDEYGDMMKGKPQIPAGQFSYRIKAILFFPVLLLNFEDLIEESLIHD